MSYNKSVGSERHNTRERQKSMTTLTAVKNNNGLVIRLNQGEYDFLMRVHESSNGVATRTQREVRYAKDLEVLKLVKTTYHQDYRIQRHRNGDSTRINTSFLLVTANEFYVARGK